MRLLPDVLLLLSVIIQLSFPGCFSLPFRSGPRKNCLACKGTPGTWRGHGAVGRPGQESTSMLAAGEPCGVYTLSCAKGLRCDPLPEEQSPLQALLQGRGVCRDAKTSIAQEPPSTEFQSPPTENSEKGPCRKHLSTVLKRLEFIVFQSDQEIYIPNCDKQGFYRRRQCWSSRGMHRGHCWCVDENGKTIPSRTSGDGTIVCDSTPAAPNPSL